MRVRISYFTYSDPDLPVVRYKAFLSAKKKIRLLYLVPNKCELGCGTLTFFLPYFLWGTGTILTVYRYIVSYSYLSFFVQPLGDKELKREVAAFDIHRVRVNLVCVGGAYSCALFATALNCSKEEGR
jgi:hypothetical protein